MSQRVDPFERRKSFHAAPASAHSTQAIRRHLALEQQRHRRTTAIEAARTAFRGLDDLQDLSLAGSSADEADSPPPTSPAAHTNFDRRPSRSESTLAAGDLTAVDSPAAPPPPNISKTKRRAFKPKYKAWAKNLLSYAETLDLRYGLPEGIETEWRAVVVPKGKRCLCATASEQGGNNTILYSRVAGRALGRFSTALPADCLLDCVWDSHLNVLWVLDVCKWRSQYLVQCEAEMRAFFISSKLSELPTQMYAPPSATMPDPNPTATAAATLSGPRPLLVLPVPNLPPPLSPRTLLPLLSTLSASPPTTPSLSISALVKTPPTSTFDAYELTVPLHPTGLLLYLSAAHYESGSTPLVSWVPCATAADQGGGGGGGGASAVANDKGTVDDQAEGVRRLGELVQLWEAEGAPRIAPTSLLPHVGIASPSQSEGMDDAELPAAAAADEIEMDG